MKFGAYLRQITCGAWNEFTENPRLYALFFAGPACLAVIVWLTHVVALPRWEQPIAQIDVLKTAIVILCFTHLIVVVALAAVRVAGRGPGGFSFDIDSDDGQTAPRPVHMEGQVTLTPAETGTPEPTDGGELPAGQRLP